VENSSEIDHSGRGATDRQQYRQAAAAFAEAVIRSVELIVQAEAMSSVKRTAK
jgi:hypothetical protein